MRIRKRTPARAASPSPPPLLPLPLPLPLQQQQPKMLQEDVGAEEEEEDKRVILIAGGRDDPREEHDDDDGPVPAAASENSSSAPGDAVPKPEPQDAAARCSRNDGKRWRCKSAAAPGYLFCDRHIAWSTRKRKPRPTSKFKNHGGGGPKDKKVPRLDGFQPRDAGSAPRTAVRRQVKARPCSALLLSDRWFCCRF